MASRKKQTSSGSPSVSTADLPIHSFSTAREFEEFLEREHETNTQGIHVKFAKKHSGIPSISGAEAVEVALCFGWIDGKANGIDENWWMVRYTPRRAKSLWSKKNVETVGRLIATTEELNKSKQPNKVNSAGKEAEAQNTSLRTLFMRPAGLAAVEAAKQDGRWERAYAGPATIEVPDDFRAALDNNPAANLVFDAFNKSERYAVLWKVETASPKARPARIQALIQMLSMGKQAFEKGKKSTMKPKTQAPKPGKPNKVVKNALPVITSSSLSSSTKKSKILKQKTKKPTKDDDDDDNDFENANDQEGSERKLVINAASAINTTTTIINTTPSITGINSVVIPTADSEIQHPRRSGLRTRTRTKP